MSITNVKNVFSTYTYDDTVETKNYHRVLFKPGAAVQARELTELQTNLQRQIDYHGQYAFADGSRVVGGEVALNTDYDFIKVETSFTDGSGPYNSSTFITTIADTVGAVLTNGNGVKAKVIQVISEAGVELKSTSNKTGILDSGNTSDPLTVYIKYIEGSGTTNSNLFAVGEVLTSSTGASHKLMVGGGTDTDNSGTNSTIGALTAIGKGSSVTINEGVYFISGNFAHVAADRIILQKYDNTPTNIIGLNIVESVVTSATETNLLDNATGFPNASAPGADRYKIATQLIKADPASPNAAYTNYIILLTVKDGVKQIEVAPAAEVDTGLTKRLARRTSEESGDYALKPFALDIREYFDDGINGGYKTAAVIQAEEASVSNAAQAKAFGEKKYVVGVEPNIAYVQGYRTENIATKFVTVDKPREVTTAPYDYVVKNQSTTRLDIGNYVKVDISSASTSSGFPDIVNFSELALIDTAGGATTPVALVDSVALANAAAGLQGTYYFHDHASDTKCSSVGGGSGARLKVVIDNAGIATIEVTEGGKDYAVNDTFTILGSAFTGGADTTNNLTFDVAQIGHGRARARAIEVESATVLKVYLFDIVMTSGTFARIDKIEQLTTATGGGAFFGNLVAGAHGKRFDAQNNSMVFRLPNRGIKTTEDATTADKPVFTYQKRLFADNAGGIYKDFSSQLAADEILVGTSAIISIGSGTGTDVQTATGTVSTDGQAGTITVEGLTSTSSVCAIVTVQKVGSVDNKKSKSFNTVTNTAYKFDGTNPVLLNAYDIYSVVSIKQGSASGPDITDLFKLDNGQRANFYGEGRLIPIGNPAAGDIYVTFYHYTHGTGQYITKDSYDSITDTNHDLNQIPLLKTPEGTFDLKDCIDFRPVKGTIGTHSNNYSAIGDSTFNPDSTGSVNTVALSPSSILTLDSNVWLPRIDKLVLDRNGNYKIIKGLTSETPIAPEDPMDAMVIGTLRVSPFAYNAKAHVKYALNDHKRYTMRHIGDLSKRVKNLEYYTSLSLLESATLAISVPDAGTQAERFKNGIFVEPFVGHSNGMVEHKNYHCAIDKALGFVRPKFDEQHVKLNRLSGDTGLVTQNGSVYTLPFSHQTFVDQPAATLTEFVNPYNVFTWGGTVKLSPESDEWKDTDHRPDVLVNETGEYDQMLGMLEEQGILGTVWNEWETNWTGRNSDTETYGHHGRNANNGNPNDVLLERTSDFNEWGGYTYLSGQIVTTTEFEGQSRSGLTTSISSDTITEELGSKIVETNYIPFIRSREIFFRAEMLKPTTKMYAFFNEVDVTGYCGEKSFQPYSTATSVVGYTDSTAHPAATELVSDASGIIEGSFIIPNNEGLRFKSGTRLFRLSDSSTNNQNTETTYAEANYYAQGMLDVMENTIVSTKVPKVTTVELNEDRVLTDTTVDDNRTTEWYDPLAQTILIDQEGGIFATKLDIFVAASEVSASGRSGIPLQVSIRETENGYPTQRIVPGTETILYPHEDGSGSVKNTIYTGMVSSTGAVACPVTFEHPVYLSQDVEYAIVLISNSDTYKVAVAETGAFDLQTNARVAKQPYNGVFFKSQNGSTWTAEQGKDLKFKLYRAEFTNSGTTVTFVNDQLPVKKLKSDPFLICTASGDNDAVLRVSHPNHGMMPGSKVTIAGAAAVSTSGAITAAMINTTHFIADIELDSYTIRIQDNAINAMTADEGKIAGGANVTATQNMTIDALIPYNEAIQLPETGITVTANSFSARSQDGLQPVFVAQPDIPLSINNNNFFNNPLAIASGTEVTAGTGGLPAAGGHIADATKSFALTCKFTTDNSFLSPVIDGDRASLFCISNRTNDATSNSSATYYDKATHGRNYVPDTSPEGNSNLNNFITKEISLANEATQLNAYAEVHRPSGSSIDLYYRVKAQGDDSDFNDLPWYLLSPKEPIPIKDSGTSHVEYSQLIEDVVTGVSASVPVNLSSNVQAVPVAPTRPEPKSQHDFYEEYGVYDALTTYADLYFENSKNDAVPAVANALADWQQKSAKADAAMAAASGKVEITFTDPAGNEPTASNADGTTGGATSIVASPPADRFGSFAFKIVLRTNNSCKVPMVKNFRSIATT